jgi:hypothetical protein
VIERMTSRSSVHGDAKQRTSLNVGWKGSHRNIWPEAQILMGHAASYGRRRELG